MVFAGMVQAQNALPPIISNPKQITGNPPTKEEHGIMSTLVLVYTKTREAVKYAYNEVMYYREMRQNFTNMQEWFKKSLTRAENIWDKATQLYNNPKDIFYTMEKMEDIFDNIDYAVQNVPNELDHILARTEYTFDKMGDASDLYLHTMIPNTDETIRFIDKKLGFDKIDSTSTDSLAAAYARRLAAIEKAGGNVHFPEEELVNSAKIVAAAGMANTAMYQAWAANTYGRIDSTDRKYSGVSGANGNELAACWFAIDQTNANNKLLRNNLEDLKMFQATLGISVYEMSDERAQQLQAMNQYYDISNAMGKENAKRKN